MTIIRHVLLVLVTVWCVTGLNLIAAAAVPERKSITDLTATELASLRRGVAKMMTRDTAAPNSGDYRRSWIYWANMHSHFGSDCAGPIVGQGMAGVKTFIASTADEKTTWCRCEHGTIQFLAWHRMYLWYFERVLQEAAGDPSLRLPYWDYESDGHLPAVYRDTTYVDEQGKTVPNPLHVNARQPTLNSGRSALLPSVTKASDAMQEPAYEGFDSSLEQTPHGAVHCAIVTGSCPNGLMGSVPVSAIDPIFYAHHTNIDRLYECWLRVNESRRLPNDPGQLDTEFTFVDANGSNVTRKVRDMLTTAQLGYGYARGGGCPGAAVALAQEQTVAPPIPPETLATTGPTRIAPAVTIVPLNVSPSGRHMLSLLERAPGRTRLTIEGVQFDQSPGAMYNVYLQNADSAREQVGIINFFGLSPSTTGPQADHKHGNNNFTFDATDAMRKLHIAPDATPVLVFEPTSGLTDSSTQQLAESMNKTANVRFDSARLEHIQ